MPYKIIIIPASSIFLLVLSSYTPVYAAHLHKEKVYQECWCDNAGGVIEYVLPDKTRVDCLTDEYAIEIDFAEKWAESIGQALYYAAMTDKKPGIVLILEDPDGKGFIKRLKVVADKLNIKVWVVGTDVILKGG